MSTKQGPAATAPQGFALFSNQALARQAMARINDLAFDHEHHLRVSPHTEQGYGRAPWATQASMI